jgi:hypothetical protein
MTEKPPWRIALEQYERAIGVPLEEYVKSDEFADRAAEAARGQAQLQREMSASTTQWLHSMNLPAASDVTELRDEIAELRREVRALHAEVAKQAAPKPRAKKAKPRSSAPRKAGA